MSQLDVNDEQRALLRDMLEAQRRELLHQDAKSNTRDFTQHVLHRLEVVEQLIAKVVPRSQA